MTGPLSLFFFQAEDGIRHRNVTGVQTCALPICMRFASWRHLIQSWRHLISLTDAPRAKCDRSDIKIRLKGRRGLLRSSTDVERLDVMPGPGALRTCHQLR